MLFYPYSTLALYGNKAQWQIFVILIVSCINTIVAPSNLIITASMGMELAHHNTNVWEYHDKILYLVIDMSNLF